MRGLGVAALALLGALAVQVWSSSTPARADGLLVEISEDTDDNFVMEWDTRNTSAGSTGNRTIRLPLTGSAADHYFRVNWGDGDTTTTDDLFWNSNSEVKHTYDTPGVYEVTIHLGPRVVQGVSLNDPNRSDDFVMKGFKFGGGSDRLKLINVKQWGLANLGNTGHYFQGAANMNATATDALRNVPTNMYAAFAGASSFNGNIGNWDMSKVTDTRFMFSGATSFNRSLNSWNMGKVTQATAMFQEASAFNGDVGNWNTAKMAYMDYMFDGASSFNQPLNAWNTSAVTTMTAMFQNAAAFNRDLSSWNTNRVAQLGYMFYGASAFNGAVGTWNTSRVGDMGSLFYRASSFNQPIGSWNTSNVTVMHYMLSGASSFNQPIGGWNTGNVTDMTSMLSGAASFNQPLGGWNTAKVTSLRTLFNGASSFNQPLGAWNTAAVTDMSFMFSGAQTFDQDIGSWNTAKVTTMSGMFQKAQVFDAQIGNWTTSNVTDISYMFSGALAFNQDVSNWNTAKVTTMSYTFSRADAFQGGVAAWDVANVIDMTGMFHGAKPMTAANYDALLIAWAAQPVKANVGFTAGKQSKFDGEAAALARQSLIDAKGWHIEDGGRLPQPVVRTDSATDVTPTSAVLRATVRPFGNPTTGLTIKYSTSRAAVESGDGTSATVAPTANFAAIDGTVTAPVSGLTPRATYFYRAAVANDTWSTAGEVRQFLAGERPVVAISPATDITTTGAQLNVSVNPNGFPTTDLSIRYAATNAELDSGGGILTSVTPTNVSGSIATNVSATVSGLTADTTYYYRVSATAAGTTVVAGEFTTSPVAGPPRVTANPVSDVLSTSATVHGTVNSTGVAANGLKVRYATSSQTLEAGGGTERALSPTSVTAVVPTPVSASLTGLNTSTRYFYVISATNIHGTTTSSIMSFTTAGRPFVSMWDTTKGWGSPSVALPLRASGGTYNFTVNWGDGTSSKITSGTAAAKTHNYATAGVKTITITGTFVGWQGGDIGKLVDITQWGSLKLGESQYGGRFFANAMNLRISATDAPDLSATTNLSEMFYGATGFNSPIGHWNTSTITEMEEMFYNAKSFNQPIDAWNTSKVTNMKSMFEGATAFNQPIGSWNTSRVEGATRMFYDATAFNQPIGSWDTRGVKDMSYTFYGATAFNQPIGSWNTSNVKNMSSMFKNATAFNQPIGSWNTSNVDTMTAMFDSATAFNQPIGSWNTATVSGMSDMFSRASSFNQPIGTWDTRSAQYLGNMFFEATAFNQPIGTWNTAKVSQMNQMFWGATSFNQPIGSWNTSELWYVSSMFKNATAFNQPIGSWNTAKFTEMRSMFEGASSFNQPISSWNTAVVISMDRVFSGASSFNQSIGSWNTSNVLYMSDMFKNAAAFNQPLDTWNTAKVTNMKGMFEGATSFNQSLGSWDASSLTGSDSQRSMSSMLSGSGLSVESYDATLVGWAGQAKSSVTVGASGLFYSAEGAVSRAALIARGWSFAGDELSVPPVLVTGSASDWTVGSSSVVVSGSVNPENRVVSSRGFWIAGDADTFAAGGGQFVPVSGSVSGAAPVTMSVTVTGLNPETEYFVQAAASGTGGSARGDVVSVVTLPLGAPELPGLGPDSAPAAPFAATGEGGDGVALVSWLPGQDGGSPVTGFTVSVVPVAGVGADSVGAVLGPQGVSVLAVGGTCSAAADASWCLVPGLTNGVEYSATVTATNARGESAPSEAAVFVAGPVAPPVPVVSAIVAGDRSVEVSVVPGVGAGVATSFEVRVMPGGQCRITLPEVSCVVSGLTNGVPVVVSAQAVNAVGESEFSQDSAPVMVGASAQVVSFGAAPSGVRVGQAPVAVSVSSDAPGAVVTVSSVTPEVCVVSGLSVTAVAAGECGLVASSAAVAGFAAAVPVGMSFTVAPGVPVVSFTARPEVLSVGGASVPVSAVSSAAGADVVLSGETPAVCSVAGGVVAPISVGECVVLAESSATADFEAGSARVTITVEPMRQVVSFTSVPAQITIGDTAGVSAGSDAHQASVVVSSSTPEVCVVDGTNVTAVAAGECTLVASAPAVGEFAAGSAQVSVPVVLRVQTVSFGAAPQDLSVGDAPVPVSVTSDAPGAVVTVVSASGAVCTVSELSVTAVAPGMCELHASAPAVGQYGAVVQVSLVFPIDPGTQVVSFGAAPTGVRVGDAAVQVTVSSNAPAASVVLASESEQVCTVFGLQVSAVGVGECVLRATSDAVGVFEQAQPVSMTFSVAPRVQTVTFGQGPGSVRVGGTGSLTAASDAPGAVLVFTSLTPSVCTVSGSTVSGVSIGQCRVGASAAAVGDYADSAQVVQVFSVAPRVQTLTFGPAPAGVGVGGTGSVNAASNAAGAVVEYTSLTPSVCTVSGSTVSGVSIGQCGVRASAAAVGDYGDAAPVVQTFTVTPREHTVSFGPAPTGARIGGTVTVNASSNAPDAVVTYTSTTPDVCEISGSQVSGVAAGECRIRATADPVGQYGAASPVTQTFTINPRQQTLAFTTAPTQLNAGQDPVTVAVTSNAPHAVITIVSATPGLCSVTGTQVSALTPGTCVIRANADPIGEYGASDDAGLTIAIAGVDQVLSVATPPAGLVVNGPAVSVEVVSDAVDAEVTYRSSSVDVCTVSGVQVSPIAAGKCTLVATAAATGIFNATSVTIEASVGKGVQVVGFTTRPVSLTAGEPTSRVVATSNAPGARVTYSSSTTDVCTVRGTALTAVAAGECVVQASAAATANFEAAAAVSTVITVDPATPPLVAPPSPLAPSVAGVRTGDRHAVVTVAAGDGGAPDTVTVTAAPGGAQCQIAYPDTSCTVSGLRNGTAYTFTATSSNDGGTSEPAAASAEAVPDRRARLNLQISKLPRAVVTRARTSVTVTVSDPNARAGVPASTQGTAVLRANGRKACTARIIDGTGTCRYRPRRSGVQHITATYQGVLQDGSGVSTATLCVNVR